MSTFAHRSKKHTAAPSKKSPKLRSGKVVFIPRSYQKKTIKFNLSRPAAGNLLGPGLGKTMSQYQTFLVLKELGYVDTLLVVTKLRPAYEVWPAEIEKWGLPLSCAVLHGPRKNEELERKVDAKIINYDGLEWLVSRGKRKLSKVFGKLMIVFDESSAVKNDKSLRFQLCKELMEYGKRRYIGTGSPAPKGLLGLWAQIYLLDAGKSLGTLFTHYRSKYFEPDYSSQYPKWVPKPNAEKKIFKRIAHLVIRFGDEELDLPPRFEPPPIMVDLPPKVRRVYDDMERDLFAHWGDGHVLAKNVGVATMKLRQIANGGLYYEDSDTGSRKYKKLHDAKTDAALELLDGLEGQPTLVAYEFHHDLDRLIKALPKDTPHIGHGVSMKRMREIIQAWNRGDIETLLGQPQSMAHGLNMQTGGRAVIWHSLTWNYEDYDQFIRRIWRQGQEHKVTIYHITARDTVDQAIMRSLAFKEKTQNRMFDFLIAYRKQRTGETKWAPKKRVKLKSRSTTSGKTSKRSTASTDSIARGSRPSSHGRFRKSA